MIWSKHNISFPSARIDTLTIWLLRGGTGIAGALLLLILLFLVFESWPALWHISPERFLTDPSWMSISVQNFPLVSVQLFPLYRFAERDFCDA